MTILTLIGVVLFTLAASFFFSLGRLIHPASAELERSWVAVDLILFWVGVFLVWLGIWGGRERYGKDIPSKNSGLGYLLALGGTALGVWLAAPLLVGYAQSYASRGRLTPQQSLYLQRLEQWVPRPAYVKDLPGPTKPAAVYAGPVEAAGSMSFPGRTAKTDTYVALGTRKDWPAIIEAFKQDQPVYYLEDKASRMNLAVVAPIIGLAYEQNGELKKAAYYYAVGAKVSAEVFPDDDAGIHANLEKALQHDAASPFVQKVKQGVHSRG